MLSLPEKILILRLSSIGDIVLTSPVIRTLRNSAPKNAQIDFVVKKEFSELIKSSHHLSTVFELDSKKNLKNLIKILKAEKYDLVVDLHDNYRTKYIRNLISPKEVVSINKQTWERFKLVYFKINNLKNCKHIVEKYFDTIKNFNVKYDNKGLEIFIPDEIQFKISSFISTIKLKEFNKVFGICAGAKHFTKRWPVEKFLDLSIALIKKYNAKILLFGGLEDKKITDLIFEKIKIEVGEKYVENFAGRFSLLETTQIFEYCDIVISNDTGLMHLASAKQKPIVAIFGSSVKEFGFYPFETKNILIENNNLGCRPCSHIGREECPKKHFNCMNEISVNVILNAVEKLL